MNRKTMSGTLSLLVLAAALGLGLAAQAAIPRRPLLEAAPVVGGNTQLIEALKLPVENRIQALRAQGPRAWEKLSQMAFDPTLPLEVRWRAITTLPHVDRDRGKVVIERALKSQEWYMRNAAAIALPAFDREYALAKSEILIADPALVVRTAAVENVLRLNGRELSDVLWGNLNASLNFRNGKSLWVRRHIAKTLAEFARLGQESKFVAILKDQDSRLHIFAIRALEKITGHSIGSEKESVESHRTKWLAWWTERQS